ncbi:MAG TPA: radical SAM protein [Verrucomicrobiota bacterium]|nr:radical SAM protein [Verrucomicrobiales bacterium]HRI14109.1 radical SAM protein [Verrucomicrobiota bacterium]
MFTSWLPTSAHLLSRGRAQDQLHAHAAEAARARFGSRVFVRAVVEVSNYCRENCQYCGMRRDNRALDRYRAEFDSLADLLLNHRPASVTDINFQTGEDPVAAREVVLPLLRLLRSETGLGLSVCLGTLSQSLAGELRAAGAQVYIIKFEIADAARYSAFEAPGILDERIAYIRWLAAEGWAVSSGFIAGLPRATIEAELQNLRFAATLPLRGCSVSPFIPGEATPLSDSPVAPVDLTLNCMAAVRLMRPDWVIPAVSALNLAGPGAGYRRGLRTGANLCTINLTPDSVRSDYLLYKRDRFIMNEERILEALAAERLEPSTESLADSLSSAPSLVAA